MVSKAPPTRASTVMFSTGVLTPTGPQKCVKCSGSIRQVKTSSRGASKTRVNVSSSSLSFWSLMCVSFLVQRRLLLNVSQVRVEFVESFRPDPSVLFDPSHRGVQCFSFEMTWPKLSTAGPCDESTAFEHFEVLGDTWKGHVERRRQVIHRGVTPCQTGHNRSAGRVG